MTDHVRAMGPKKWSSKYLLHLLPGRSGKQVRERWYNHLSPDIIKTPWTPDEDRLILQVCEKVGTKWTFLASLLPGRTDMAIKNRWYGSLQHKAARENLAAKEGDDELQELFIARGGTKTKAPKRKRGPEKTAEQPPRRKVKAEEPRLEVDLFWQQSERASSPEDAEGLAEDLEEHMLADELLGLTELEGMSPAAVPSPPNGSDDEELRSCGGDTYVPTGYVASPPAVVDHSIVPFRLEEHDGSLLPLLNSRVAAFEGSSLPPLIPEMVPLPRGAATTGAVTGADATSHQASSSSTEGSSELETLRRENADLRGKLARLQKEFSSQAMGESEGHPWAQVGGLDTISWEHGSVLFTM